MVDLILVPLTTADDNIHLKKRQRIETSKRIIHLTVTRSGTIVYTHTATQYSYIPSITMSTISPTATSQLHRNYNNSKSNTATIIGGTVGGIGTIVFIGLVYFLLRRSQNKNKRKQKNEILIEQDKDMFDYQEKHYRSLSRVGTLVLANQFDSAITTPSVTMISSSKMPAPRHMISPFTHQNAYYYDDILPRSYSKTYLPSTRNSLVSSSIMLSTVDVRNVPNEVDLQNPQERHVPHLKESNKTIVIMDSPHTKD